MAKKEAKETPELTEEAKDAGHDPAKTSGNVPLSVLKEGVIDAPSN